MTETPPANQPTEDQLREQPLARRTSSWEWRNGLVV